MYRVSVPVTTFCLDTYGTEKYIKLFKDLDAERIFLCPDSGIAKSTEIESRELISIEKNCEILHRYGFEVGVWIWAFHAENDSRYTYITNADGKADTITVCPADELYRERMCSLVKSFAKTDIDLIMFDDDYRFGFHSVGFGCCCENHRKMISKELNENVSLTLLKEKLLYGEPNKYRDAFIKCNGKSLEDFADCMRKAVDEVNPDLRMGYCTCITNWDIDGTHPDIISKKLAGKTKPFYRLIGAPYWGKNKNWGNRLSDVIEFERAEASRCTDANTEIFSEGDVFPRPRYNIPSSYSEGFDTALRAAGCTDGILKYALDYTSSPEYETGYVKSHIKNKNVYKKISEFFDGKKSIGVRVYDKAAKFGEITVPGVVEGKYDIQNLAFGAGSKMMCYSCIPTVYGSSGRCGVAFGEDVKAVPENELNGLILDISAAQTLAKKGIDTGLISIGEDIKSSLEIFGNENVSIFSGGIFKKTVLNENAVIESEFTDNNKNRFPASYKYENENGERFFVFCFEAYFNSENLFRMYERNKQINNAILYLTGKEPAVKCSAKPDLYIQAKEDEKEIAVGLWNFFEDETDETELIFDRKIKSVKTLNCNAVINGNKVTVDNIKPFGFCAVVCI